MPLRAQDVVTRNVISASEDAPVHEVVKLLLRYRISGGPVVVEDTGQRALAESATKALPDVEAVENNLALAPVSGVPV